MRNGQHQSARQAGRKPTGQGGAVNRRTFELIIVTVVLVEVARVSLLKLWAHKAFVTTSPDSLSHKVAEVGVLLT